MFTIPFMEIDLWIHHMSSDVIPTPSEHDGANMPRLFDVAMVRVFATGAIAARTGASQGVF